LNQDGYNSLLDDIYATVLEPASWISVMERLADMLNGNSAFLSQISVEDGKGAGVIARIDPVMPQLYLEHFAGANPFLNKNLLAEYSPQWKPPVKSDAAFVDKDVLVKSEYYNDFMRPQDIHSILMIDVAAQGPVVSTVNIHRSQTHGQFGSAELEIVNALHPHLIRAFKLGGVFGQMAELSDHKAAALDDARRGIFILDAKGGIRYANRVAERILARRSGLGVMGGRLTGRMADSAKTLQALIAIAGSPDPDVRRGGSMVIACGETRLPLTVMPLRAGRLPVFAAGPSVLVTVTDLHADLAIADGELQALFGLTVAEIRVVRALLQGHQPRDAAEKLGVSVNTVRTQLASIFQKTATSGQNELLLLLMRML
jgi:DNA-binding CsgD family transcriptional regulator/PAS domain-containing protein